MNEMGESVLRDSLLILSIVIFIFLLGLFIALRALDIIHIGMLSILAIIIVMLIINIKIKSKK